MKVTDVRAMIAIGLRRQFGLRGRLPWEGYRGREYVADVERFFELTRGHVVVMGHRTFTSVPDFAFKDRDILEIHASERPDQVLARFPSRVVFIGGGPPVYAAYAPFIRHWDINRLPYNGEADRWFDPAWLVAGARCFVDREAGPQGEANSGQVDRGIGSMRRLVRTARPGAA